MLRQPVQIASGGIGWDGNHHGMRIRGQIRETGLHVTTPAAPEIQSYLAEMRAADCRYAVIESTSHGLALSRVAAIDYDVAAVTNITHEHLDHHGTRDAYVAAKAKLFQALFESAVKNGIPKCAVLNADDPGSYDALRKVMHTARKHHRRSIVERAYGLATGVQKHDDAIDVLGSSIEHGSGSTHFSIRWWAGQFDIKTQLLGDFNVYNILCAATVSLALGIAPEAIQAGVAGLSGVLGRMERIDVGQPFLAVVDFAHSPASLERALLTLRNFVGHGTPDGPGRLIAIFGSAGLRDHAKRRLMGQISGQLADFTVITAEDPRTEDLDAINQEIAAGVVEHSTEYVIIPDRTEAIRYAVQMAQPGDVVAAFGKGHERSLCFGTTEYPWNEQQVMADALREVFPQTSRRIV